MSKKKTRAMTVNLTEEQHTYLDRLALYTGLSKRAVLAAMIHHEMTQQTFRKVWASLFDPGTKQRVFKESGDGDLDDFI